MTAATRIVPGGAPDQALDLLQIDGGWLTAPYLACRLDMPEKRVERALYRLRDRGWVKSRIVDLAYSNRRTVTGAANRWGGATFDSRLEWRAVLDPTHWFETT